MSCSPAVCWPLGIAAVGLSGLRSGVAGRPLIWFGLFCSLYGLRLVIDTQILSWLAGISSVAADYGAAFVTYVIPLPGLFFVYFLIGPGWKSSLLWMVRLQILYAVSALLIDSFAGVYTAMGPNNGLVILGQAVMIGNVATRRYLLEPHGSSFSLQTFSFPLHRERSLTRGPLHVAHRKRSPEQGPLHAVNWKWS
ncbi:MAG TPA: hypothetical protein VHN15_01870, partial [Thermoanaerobaculia bacterium]|nr:hypothetical protein [Thermoanaerobaculia bacterium]